MTTTLPRSRCHLQLEALEDRLTPSVNVDMVLQWNGVTRDAIRAAGTSAPAASRILAITHAAVYDAHPGHHARGRVRSLVVQPHRHQA